VSKPEATRSLLRALAAPPPIPPADEVFPSAPLRAAAAAAERGDAAALQKLAAEGADLDEIAPAGVTLLMYEIVKKNEVAVRALLEAGANPNRLTQTAASPMLVAAANQDPRFLGLLLDHGGDPNLKNLRGEPLLHQALPYGHWQNLWLLIDRGVAIDVRNPMKQTPALRLAYLNQYEQVYRFLERGADPDATDDVGLSVRALAQKPVPAADSPHEAWRKRVAERLGIPVDEGA